MKMTKGTSASGSTGSLEYNYYGSLLLFVGEGNFSFSTSLISSAEFPLLKCKLLATDYAPELEDDNLTEGQFCDDLTKPAYKHSSLLLQNVSILKSKGHQVLFSVDATKLHTNNEILQHMKQFSKIFVIFNFPHVKSKKMKIGLNRDLLRDFFISCDKVKSLLKSESEYFNVITPVVSLCAGQSGIPEVDTKVRSWGDSWQINDMAAHGNFVCNAICNFNDWNLYKISLQGYHSSYYRLQSSVSFTTTEALTFTYEHRQPVNPCDSGRLKSILKFSSDTSSSEIVTNFLQSFSPVVKEYIECASSDFRAYKQSTSLQPYVHKIVCPSQSIRKLSSYLGLERGFTFVKSDDKVSVKVDDTDETVIIGECNHEQDMTLYVNRLIELKYNCSYRLAMSDAFEAGYAKSLHPHSHEFHISFWITLQFTVNLFMDVLLDVYGLALKSIEFVEEYETETGKKSICWCIKIESLDYALSRTTAHQMYLNLRKELAQRLNLDVR